MTPDPTHSGSVWTIWICKTHNEPVSGDLDQLEDSCEIVAVDVVPAADRDQLVKAGLACLGFGNDGTVPDLLTLIERMGLRP